MVVSGEFGGVTQGSVLSVMGFMAELNGFSLSSPSILGGNSVQATVSLPPGQMARGDVIVSLGSSDPSRASVPPRVTIASGSTNATFTILTQPVSSATDVTILASRSATLWAKLQLLPPGGLSSLTLNPDTVTGGQSSQGIVSLSAPAPAGGVVVSLTSSTPRVATVPASVTIPAGAASATFLISTSSVTVGEFSVITASSEGISKSATLRVNPGSTSSETVSITRAEYEVSRSQLRVEATNTNASTTMRVLRTATNELIGTLRNDGGGRYSGQFTWPVNPQSITVRSTSGASASRTVTVK